LLWPLFAVLARTVFGTAGAWSRSADRWRVVGLALPESLQVMGVPERLLGLGDR
jgi:hypothetical protein